MPRKKHRKDLQRINTSVAIPKSSRYVSSDKLHDLYFVGSIPEIRGLSVIPNESSMTRTVEGTEVGMGVFFVQITREGESIIIKATNVNAIDSTQADTPTDIPSIGASGYARREIKHHANRKSRRPKKEQLKRKKR